jgi:hypothetical protein
MYHNARGPYMRDIWHDICSSKTDTYLLYMFHTYGSTGLRRVLFSCFQLSLVDGIVVELHDPNIFIVIDLKSFTHFFIYRVIKKHRLYNKVILSK